VIPLFKGLKYTTKEGGYFQYCPCTLKQARQLILMIKTMRPKHFTTSEASRMIWEHPEQCTITLPNKEIKPIAYCEIKTGQSFDFILGMDRKKFIKYQIPA